MSIHCRWLVILLAFGTPAWAADNPRHIDLGPGSAAVKTLEQNWSDKESNWFYNVPQGSRLIPYDWFLHLEQAESTKPFRDADNIRKLGYIARTADPLNPDGLPIGFVKDASYEDGTPGLGMTCAACHTSLIKYNGSAFLVDGAPSAGDLESLLKRLTAALQATAEDDAKFKRFSAAVLSAGASENVKAALRTKVGLIADERAAYNSRNLPGSPKHRFGPGRVDAFGAIFNEVSVRFLGIPQNERPANAPVSYPCLWDAPQHDKVQWNGAAENKVSPLGRILFGTVEVGATGRNAGEVLGVFGNVDINLNELLVPRRYPSTVKKRNLVEIESSLKTLWSPKWPQDVLGDIDEDLKAKGEVVYKKHCITCHAIIDRTAHDRRIEARISEVGTDKSMISNFGRTVNTGRLLGRRKSLLGFERFSSEEPIGVVLKHVVERIILSPNLDPRTISAALAKVKEPSSVDDLNPGYRMTATIKIGDQLLVGEFDSLLKMDDALTVGGGRFHLMQKGGDVFKAATEGNPVDLRSREGIRDAAGRLKSLIRPAKLEGIDDEERTPTATFENATAEIGYKARPLNGVWATAPYLHNGSVPNLVELLKPAAERVKTFHVGSQEYDPINVGFKNDPSQPLFDTSVPGNSNAGHEFGANLCDEERKQLLEYLKSL